MKAKVGGTVAVFVAGWMGGALLMRGGDAPSYAAPAMSAQSTQSAPPDELTALRAEVERLKTLVPDQAHVMIDVAYHFTNLYYAGLHENWPLAQFYLDTMHSHLRSAVQIVPMRKDRAGRDVDMDGILTAVEQTSLNDLAIAIKAKDNAAFVKAYATQAKFCMACHKAASREYIRLQIPDAPDSQILDFIPEPPTAPRRLPQPP
jgi:hypothetical protein